MRLSGLSDREPMDLCFGLRNGLPSGKRAIGYWLLAIGYWLLAIGYWLLQKIIAPD